MDVSEFDFDLPEALIAQQPSPERGGSRLLVVRRAEGTVEHTVFVRIADYLRRGDLLVLNNTMVYPARLLGHRVPSGGAVECLLLQRQGPHEWQALVHPGQKLKPGAQVLFERHGQRLHGEIVAAHFRGRRTIRLWSDAGEDPVDVIDRIGHVPLPPYIRRDDTEADRERYQTVYARERGSVAAPTAGLHFTAALLDDLRTAHGVELAEVTLHVGYGTFRPVTVDRVEDHNVDPEIFEVPAPAADALTRARRERRRIIAVGTTTARVLESLDVTPEGTVEAASGRTGLFIHPGHRFNLVDGLVTNFHLPRSSLLMLVAAFGGRDLVLHAYREAVARQYRFYSYGDAMLIL
jgi:S-adenosylmethionine:tRNA ribosyltransferase-isomerase